MQFFLKQYIAILACAGFVAACSSGGYKKADPNPTPADMKQGPGLFSGESGNLLDVFNGDDDDAITAGGGIGVNPYLWRAALESVSFMPMQQVDSQGGVLITDWYTNPDKTDERVKMDIYIFGRKLRPQALKVSVFKQHKMNGSWQDVAVNPQTAADLEETILTNARSLKVKDQAAR